MRLKNLPVWSSLFLLAAPLWSKDVPFQVVPWNGYKAAISLTYDDGDPIHLELVAPEMAKRHLRGTFFLITGKLDPLVVKEWKKLLVDGQEIGNHTVTHRHVADLTPADEQNEVARAKSTLERDFGVPVLTFAYPFGEESPGLLKWVEAEDFMARGVGGASYDMTPDTEPDWYNIPCQATMTAYAFDTYKNWMDQDLAAGAWAVFVIHGVEGTPWGWQPIPKATFLKILDYLVQNQKDIWIAPFSEVGAYWRAEKVLEKARPQKSGSLTTLKWDKPANFPAGVVLKLSIQGEGLKVSQAGKPVEPLSAGIYPVSFDAGELTLENAVWVPEVSHAAKTPAASNALVFDGGSIMTAPAKDVLKVDDFESGSPAFGGTWWEGCDANGVTKLSPVPFAVLQGGSPLSPGHCAGMKGHMGPQQAPWPWAVLSLNLDAGGRPVDLSAYRALRFYTQGDGKAHTVALNKASVRDYADFQANFTSPAAWAQVTVPFSDFAQANWGKRLEKKFNDVLKLTFSPGTTDPDFDFKIDDVEFVK